MVLIMFAFAFAMIGLMFLYWELHTAPFRPLQMAIGTRHPNSMPRVIGGRNRSHRPGSKSILRMIIVVDYDPTEGLPRPPRPKGSPKDEDDRLVLTKEMVLDPRVERDYGSLLHLARQTTDLSSYEEIEIFLEHRRPEKSSRTLFAVRAKDDWFAKYPTDPFAKPDEP